jgi:hypothetical protein
MNEPPAQGKPRHPLPPWSECEVFCINGYSGAGRPACGWRGRIAEVPANENEKILRCPRCASATLLRIPPPTTQRT